MTVRSDDIDALQREVELRLEGLAREDALRWGAHAREHELHLAAHQREHLLAAENAGRTEQVTEKRFETFNQFREQQRDQARAQASNDRVDGVVKDIDRRYDELRALLQGERETRQRTDGSVATWRWIAGFLGAGGISTLILWLSQRGGG